MSEYTPTTDEVREDFSFPWSPEQIGDRSARKAAFDRWLAAHDAEVRAAALAEQEPKGRRWYAACWRDDNGTLNSLDSSTVSREYAEADVKRWRAAEAKQEDGQPELVVLATKISHPWMPVEGEAG